MYSSTLFEHRTFAPNIFIPPEIHLYLNAYDWICGEFHAKSAKKGLDKSDNYNVCILYSLLTKTNTYILCIAKIVKFNIKHFKNTLG